MVLARDEGGMRQGSISVEGTAEWMWRVGWRLFLLVGGMVLFRGVVVEKMRRSSDREARAPSPHFSHMSATSQDHPFFAILDSTFLGG
jgi:hypothetical protein